MIQGFQNYFYFFCTWHRKKVIGVYFSELHFFEKKLKVRIELPVHYQEKIKTNNSRVYFLTKYWVLRFLDENEMIFLNDGLTVGLSDLYPRLCVIFLGRRRGCGRGTCYTER